MPNIRVGWWVALATAALATGARPVFAESALRLGQPDSFGEIPASTYDSEGHRVGDAHLVVERLDDGVVRLFSESGIEHGARTVVTADLEPVGTLGALRPLRQESRSFDPDGTPLGVLAIDHHTGIASCTKPNGNGNGNEVATFELPDADRVANVPLFLYFMPLIRGEAQEMEFQLFLCGRGPELVDFVASVVPDGSESGEHIVEVRYRPDLGRVVSLLARRLVPKLSFWFDTDTHRWIGHRLPLYSKGPEIFVVREGVPTGWISSQ